MISEEAFMALYQTAASDLRRYVCRVTGTVAEADDIVQEAFLRLVRHPPTGEELEDLRAYVFRIASNLVTDRNRRERRASATLAAPPERYAAIEPEARLDIARTFRNLSLRDRQLMWLAYVEGESHRAIAKAIGVGERSVGVLLSRARGRLRNLLKGRLGE
jgi:RNA polymerase sigma-70 factor (ECF subfamily)